MVEDKKKGSSHNPLNNNNRKIRKLITKKLRPSLKAVSKHFLNSQLDMV